MEYIVCGIDAGTGAPIWDVFDLEFASAAPAKDTLAHYESVTPIQLALFEEA